jgi:hypothetical protein
MKWLTYALVPLGAFVACGGKMVNDDPCGAYLDAWNAHADKCGETRVATDSEAMDVYASLCTASASAPDATNMQQQLAACTKAIQDEQRCDVTIVDCVLHGSRPDGAACGIGTQCAGGICQTTAVTASTTSEQVCGTCASYVQAGGACDATHTCDPISTMCIFTDYANASGVCRTFVKEGGDCISADSGGCGPALTCSDDGNCTKRPQRGDDCAQLNECAEPWRCIDGTCADGAGEGDACPTTFECGANLGCNPSTHVCEKIATTISGKKIGDACTVGNFECEPFVAVCIDGTCKAPDYGACK